MSFVDEIRAFDPNKPEFIPWATYGNYSGFKLHKRRGGAITAYGNSEYAILYEMGEDGLWREIVRKCREDEHETCSSCGGPTVVAEPDLPPNRRYHWRSAPHVDTRADGTRIYDAGKYDFVRRSGKIQYPLVQEFLCIHCDV